MLGFFKNVLYEKKAVEIFSKITEYDKMFASLFVKVYKRLIQGVTFPLSLFLYIRPCKDYFPHISKSLVAAVWP